MMRRNISQDAFQRADLYRAVIGDDFMVFATFLRGDAEVRTGLARDNLAELSHRLGQFVAGKIARRFHRANTSSRTKCRRIILGACWGSTK